MEESDKTGDWTQGYQFEQLVFHHYVNWTTTSPHKSLMCAVVQGGCHVTGKSPLLGCHPHYDKLLFISHVLQVMYGAGFCWPVLNTATDKGLSGGLATRL